VIVSDQVGAKVLVEKSGAGAVVKVNDVEGLAKCLEGVYCNPSQLLRWKKSAKHLRLKISPELAAKYMNECLNFSRTVKGCSMVPW